MSIQCYMVTSVSFLFNIMIKNKFGEVYLFLVSGIYSVPFFFATILSCPRKHSSFIGCLVLVV